MKQSDLIDKIGYVESAQQIEDKVMATTKSKEQVRE